MGSFIRKLPPLVIALALALVAIITHAFLVPVGMALQNSEYSSFLLTADSYRQGYRSAFPFQNNHGGLTLTFFRALFTAAWDHFAHGPWAHERGHMVFSFVICPPLLALSAYYYLLKAFDRRTALIMGLVSAVGLHLWTANYGNEFYPLMVCLGFLMMGLCAGLENPFLQLTLPRLFLLGLLAGHGVYATRSSQLYAVALLIPWRLVPGWIKELWRMGLGKAFFLLWASGVYLEVFGGDLGTIAGRAVKLDGDPHFRIVIPGLAALWLWNRRDLIKDRNILRRTTLMGVGVLVGLSPELIHWLMKGKLWGSRIIATYDFRQSMEILAGLPRHFKALVSGLHHYRSPLDFWDTGMGQNLCVILVLWAMATTVRAALKQPRFWPLVALSALNLFSYLRVSVQTTEIAPVRYLMPMTPALIGMMALWLRRRCHSGNGRPGWQAAMAVTLLVFFAGHHLAARLRLAEHIHERRIVETHHGIIEEFRRGGVPVVISDDYWMSNNLTLAAHGKPLFWATWNGWGPFSAETAAHEARHAGLLLKSSPDNPYPRPSVSALGKTWTLKPLAIMGGYELYVGDAQ